MKLSQILDGIEKELDMKIDDRSANGLQVGNEKEVRKVGFAVDATIDSFQKAKDKNCGLLIVHHGIIWSDGEKTITGNKYNKAEFLIKNDLALAAYHLPLDAHPKLGNNAQISEMLGAKNLKPFDAGFTAELRKDTGIEALGIELGRMLNTKCTVFAFGKPLFKNIAVISGFGGKDVERASRTADCFITGEVMYGIKNLAKELKTNVITAGHYETETPGLKALMEFLKKRTSLELEWIE
jgi:dinuclear metal center YbgI/SA1388 family protein